MVCPDCQVLIVKNIQTYDRVQQSQIGLVKYSSMLSSNVDSFELDEQDEKTERDKETTQVKLGPNPTAPKNRKLQAKRTKLFQVNEDIEFFHFEKAGMVPGKIMKKLNNGKYSVLVAKSFPPQFLDISPIFITKIN